MIEISHLVVNGCSFTYGQGLENRTENNWPAVLGRKLNVPVINMANPGAGCDRIFRTTQKYFYKTYKEKMSPFYIIAWSGALRREEYMADREDYYNVNLSFPDNPFSRHFILNLTDKGLIAYEERKLLYWASILNLFKAHNVNYLMTDYMPTTTYPEGYIRSFMPYVYDYVFSDPNKITDFNTVTHDYPKLPCGHDDKESQHVIADYCYEEIIKRYKEIKNV